MAMNQPPVSTDPDSQHCAALPQRNGKSLVVLLISLATVLFVVPLAESVPYVEWLLRVGITSILFSAAVVTTTRGKWIWAGSIVAAMVIPLTWATLLVDQPFLFLCTCILECLFFGAMAVMIVISVIRNYLASIHSVFGAISAYLLLGLAWAVLYWGMNQVDADSLRSSLHGLETNSDASSDEVVLFSRCIYFSFVTMSTLGFGDVTPGTSIMQTFAWMQSVVGQFYMAVLVAWLVSEIPKRADSTFAGSRDVMADRKTLPNG